MADCVGDGCEIECGMESNGMEWNGWHDVGHLNIINNCFVFVPTLIIILFSSRPFFLLQAIINPLI